MSATNEQLAAVERAIWDALAEAEHDGLVTRLPVVPGSGRMVSDEPTSEQRASREFPNARFVVDLNESVYRPTSEHACAQVQERIEAAIVAALDVDPRIWEREP